MRKIFVFAITLTLLLSGVLIAVENEATEGEKSVSEGIQKTELREPQEIHDWHDLDDVRDDLDNDYILMSDLDEDTAGYDELVDTEGGWNPIGNNTNSFTGTFDGNEYEISDLYIHKPSEDLVGLFGTLAEDGEVMDIGIVEADITGKTGVGTLVGYKTGIGSNLSNTYVTGKVNGAVQVGGLVGVNEGVVENSYARANVTADMLNVGGLIGENKGTVEKSYAAGEVSGGYDMLVGGLTGKNSGLVRNSFWDMEASGQNNSSGGTGKTTAEMKNITTFTNLSTVGLLLPWDFVGGPYDDEGDEDIWEIDENGTINDGYPFLSWEDDEEEGSSYVDEKDFLGFLSDYWWLITLVGVVGIIAIVIAMVMRREKYLNEKPKQQRPEQSPPQENEPDIDESSEDEF